MRDPVQALIELCRDASCAIIKRCAVKGDDDTDATHGQWILQEFPSNPSVVHVGLGLHLLMGSSDLGRSQGQDEVDIIIIRIY